MLVQLQYLVIRLRLNLFTSLTGPLELVLSISGFCSVKRMRVIDSPWTGHQSTGYSQHQKLILILPTS